MTWLRWNFNAAEGQQKKIDLENQANQCDVKIGRANQLLDRWILAEREIVGVNSWTVLARS
jgi:hypothetical protein